MRNTLAMLTPDEWQQWRQMERRQNELKARAQLEAFFSAHATRTFQISGERITGETAAVRVTEAPRRKLRAFYDAAQEHKRRKR